MSIFMAYIDGFGDLAKGVLYYLGIALIIPCLLLGISGFVIKDSEEQ